MMDSKGSLTRSKSTIERPPRQASTSDPSISPNSSSSSYSEDQLCGGRPRLPPWDRTVDVVFHKYKHGDKRPSRRTAFEASLIKFLTHHGRRASSERTGFLALPDKIRFRVFQYLFASHGLIAKPITLNNFCFNQDCWEPFDFVPLHEALLPFQQYLQVSFGFYADTMLMFLSAHTFHAVLSPFTAPRISPLATTWLNRYGMYMRSIIVEVDLTRFGLGPEPTAKQLYPGIEHLQQLLFDFSVSQADRDTAAPLDSLILLCRRFYGYRSDSHESPRSSPSPSQVADTSIASSSSQSSTAETISMTPFSDSSSTATDMPTTSPDQDEQVPQNPDQNRSSWASSSSDSSQEASHLTMLSINSSGTYSSSDSSDSDSKLYYCPEKYLIICNHLIRLRNHVNSIRMAGFTSSYTHQFIASLFPDVKDLPVQQHSYQVAPSTLWPRLRGQKSWIDIGHGTLVLDDHEAMAETCIFPEGPMQLPPPIVSASGATSLPWYFRVTSRPRNSTVSSGSTWPSMKSAQGGGQSNTSSYHLIRAQDEDNSRMQRFLRRVSVRSKRRVG